MHKPLNILADHVDSDLEKVDLVLEDDTVVNNEDIFIIETGKYIIVSWTQTLVLRKPPNKF